MFLAQIEVVADAPLEAVLEDLRGWPVVNANWSAHAYLGTEQTMGRMLGLYNSPTLIRMMVATDDKNSSQRVIQVQGQLPV